MAQGFGWSDHIEKNFRQIGVEAFQFLANALPLQEAWCRENLVTRKSGLDLLLAQIAQIKPTVLFIEDPLGFKPGWIKIIRERVSSIRLVIGTLCAPYGHQHTGILSDLDCLLTCTPGFVRDFQSKGLKAHLWLHAFEGSLLPKIAEQNSFPESKVVFTGSFFAGQSFHDERSRLVADLLKNDIPIDIYGQIIEPPYYKVVGKSVALTLAKWLTKSRYGESIARQAIISRILNSELDSREGRALLPKIRNCIKPPVYGLEMMKVLAKSDMALNVHIGVAGAYAGNQRLFEATGAGTCLLTDWKENLGSLFEIDTEVVAFSSSEECIEKARWLLDHPQERVKIARAGQERTLKDHSLSGRVKEVDDLIRAHLH